MTLAPLFATAAACLLACGPVLAKPVTFAAADGVTVHADYRGDGAGPLILLFHQAGSNHHEYDPVAPMLNDIGFDTLAVDQRSGGSAFGFANETAKAASGDYIAAYADLEAALAWGRAQGAGPIVALGSSYSSSLVFVLAADHPEEVAAILAFSPGEYFGQDGFVRAAAAKVRQPVFVSSASDSGEISAAREIVSAVKGRHEQFKPKAATHGASALRADVNPEGAALIWQAVAAFLATVK